MIWLKVGVTNRDPAVILGYFTEAVRNINVGGYIFGLSCRHKRLSVIINLGCPQVVRLDKGTENARIAQCQIALRMCHLDEHACAQSVRYGPSPTNSVRNKTYI